LTVYVPVPWTSNHDLPVRNLLLSQSENWPVFGVWYPGLFRITPRLHSAAVPTAVSTGPMNAVPMPRPSTSTAPVDAGQSGDPAKFGALSNCAWMFLMTPEFGGSPHAVSMLANPTIAATTAADVTNFLNMFPSSSGSAPGSDDRARI